jgi:N-acetylglucosamine malate deacetylase 1
VRTVLVVVAHPDDAEIAMGMRIRWHTQQGDRVRVHCLTTGTPDPHGVPVRRNECLQAGALLGAEYSFSAIPDTRFVEHRGEINGDLFTLFAETRPDVVYTHYPHDQHLDHRITADETTVVAMREAQNLLYIRSPYSQGFEPTLVFMGTPELLAAKMDALASYTSQSQLDMTLYRQLAEVGYRQHVHHRVVKRLPKTARCAELFIVARRMELAD